MSRNEEESKNMHMQDYRNGLAQPMRCTKPIIQKRIQAEAKKLSERLSRGPIDLLNLENSFIPREGCEWILVKRGIPVGIRFTPDYPFRPPLFLPVLPQHTLQDIDFLLGKGPEVIKGDWTPTMSAWEVLVEAPGILPKTSLESTATSDGGGRGLGRSRESLARLRLLKGTPPSASARRVAYISIGCGGPVMKSKYPPLVQHVHENGGEIVLILIDPQLTFSPLLSEPRLVQGPRFRAFLCDIGLRSTQEDVGEFCDVLEVLQDQNFHIWLEDWRGSAYGGLPYPLTIPMLVDMDVEGVDVVKRRVEFKLAKGSDNFSPDPLKRDVVIESLLPFLYHPDDVGKVSDAVLNWTSGIASSEGRYEDGVKGLLYKLDRGRHRLRVGNIPKQIMKI